VDVWGEGSRLASTKASPWFLAVLRGSARRHQVVATELSRQRVALADDGGDKNCGVAHTPLIANCLHTNPQALHSHPSPPLPSPS
jgi:hypothetical protein